MNKLIAIVEDEPDVLNLISLHLKKSGFTAAGFPSAALFFDFLSHNMPDLIILDLMLPDMDGLEICRRLKKEENYSGIPIIMLTAKGEETDKVVGLELGADDYVTKPFSPRELIARIKAILRRSANREKNERIIVGEDIVIDPEKYEVFVFGNRVELTSTEFRIIKLLANRKGRVFSRDEILDCLWEHDKAVTDRTIDVHIKHLRDKLGEAGKHIKNVRGVGYKIEE